MKILATFIATLMVFSGGASIAADADDTDLKMSALEALMASPSERALPSLLRFLDTEDNAVLQERALFVLSHIDHPDAHKKLVTLATDDVSPLRHEAIRMIGISGREASLQAIATLRTDGNPRLRDAILEAYLISGDETRMYDFALAAENPQDFEAAVNLLAAMGARTEIRALRDAGKDSESLISAMGIARDVDGLLVLARDGSNVRRQVRAIEALGLTGSGGPHLIDIYGQTDERRVKEAVRHGLLVAGHDEGVVDLYRAAEGVAEKKELLQLLVMMNSDHAIDIIDEALSGGKE